MPVSYTHLRAHETDSYLVCRLLLEKKDIEKLISLMSKSTKPVFYSGGGVINSGPKASKLLRELVNLTGFPITSTLQGLGAFPGDDNQFIGMLGMHGTYEANNACLLYTSPSPRDGLLSRMPSSA